MDNELIKSCEAKAEAWLSSSVYDAATQAEVRKMLDNPDKTDWWNLFIRIWNSERAVCAASWEWARTV